MRYGCCDSIEEDQAVVWNRHVSTFTDYERDLICAALTLDGPEVCAENRRKWEAIAEEARRPGRLARAQTELEAAIVSGDVVRVSAALRARRALQEAHHG